MAVSCNNSRHFVTDLPRNAAKYFKLSLVDSLFLNPRSPVGT